MTADGDSFVVRSAIDVCRFVDDLPAESAGEITFLGPDDEPLGSAFIERGRFCWAAARGLAPRLSDLLARSAGVDRAEMEDIYQLCRRDGVPLGEHLLRTERVTASELRFALLEHATESLSALCAAGALGKRGTWTPHSRGTYCPRFTFSTTELLARTVAEAHRPLADDAAAELAASLSGNDWGAAFVRSAGRSIPDPIALHGPSPDRVEGIVWLGRWASSSLDVASPLETEPGGFVATMFDDGALVAWRFGSSIMAGHTSLYGPARLLNRLAQARRGGLHHGGL